MLRLFICSILMTSSIVLPAVGTARAQNDPGCTLEQLASPETYSERFLTFDLVNKSYPAPAQAKVNRGGTAEFTVFQSRGAATDLDPWHGRWHVADNNWSLDPNYIPGYMIMELTTDPDGKQVSNRFRIGITPTMCDLEGKLAAMDIVVAWDSGETQNATGLGWYSDPNVPYDEQEFR